MRSRIPWAEGTTSETAPARDRPVGTGAAIQAVGATPARRPTAGHPTGRAGADRATARRDRRPPGPVTVPKDRVPRETVDRATAQEDRGSRATKGDRATAPRDPGPRRARVTRPIRTSPRDRATP